MDGMDEMEAGTSKENATIGARSHIDNQHDQQTLVLNAITLRAVSTLTKRHHFVPFIHNEIVTLLSYEVPIIRPNAVNLTLWFLE